MEQYLAHNAPLLKLEALWKKDRPITRSPPTEDNIKKTYTTSTYTDLVHLSSRIRNQGSGVLGAEDSKHLNRRNHRSRVYKPPILLCIFV